MVKYFDKKPKYNFLENYWKMFTILFGLMADFVVFLSYF